MSELQDLGRALAERPCAWCSGTGKNTLHTACQTCNGTGLDTRFEALRGEHEILAVVGVSGSNRICTRCKLIDPSQTRYAPYCLDTSLDAIVLATESLDCEIRLWPVVKQDGQTEWQCGLWTDGWRVFTGEGDTPALAAIRALTEATHE